MAGGLAVENYEALFLTETVMYDPKSYSLQVGNSLNESRKQHRATRLLDGRVLLTGGSNEKGDLKSTELYGEQRVIQGPDMLFERREHCSVLLPNGNVFIAGGYSNGIYNNTTEIFNPIDNVFSRGPDMANARAYPTCTLLPDADVLIAGGSGYGGALKSAELLIY